MEGNRLEHGIEEERAALRLPPLMRRSLLGLLAVAAGAAVVFLTSEPVPVAPDDGVVETRLHAALDAALTARDIDERVRQLLDDGRPEEAASYIALAHRLGRPLAHDVTVGYAQATTTAATLLREGRRGVWGFVSGEAEGAAGFVGAALSDVLVYGDVRDLALQTGNVLRGGEADAWILGLSVAGLGMTAATVASGGASAPTKAGISIVKAAKRTGALTAGLEGVLRRTVLATADLPGLRRHLSDADWRSPGRVLDGLRTHAAALDTATLRGLLGRVGTIAERTSPTAALRILRHVDSVDELAQAERVSARFGKATAATFDTLGKRTFKAFATVATMTAAAWVLATALVSLAMSALWILLWLLWFLLKRLVRRRPRRPAVPPPLADEPA